MFEARLELFCKSKGIAQNEFLKRCREATVEDEKSKLYMNILLSSVEYETFVKLMYIMKPVAEKRHLMEAEAKAIEDRYAADGKDEKNGSGSGSSGSPSKEGRNDNETEMKEIDSDTNGNGNDAAEAKGGSDDYDDSKGASK